MTQAGFSYGPSVSLFYDMVDGNFPEFSKAFGEFFLTPMPQRIFGSQEWVYQDWVYAYISGIVGSMGNKTWTTRMEVVAGDGRTDIILHDEEKGGYSWVQTSSASQKKGYRDYEASLLSKATNGALDQRDYYIVEYGIAFLGPYCAVEARMLERKDGKWTTQTKYSSSTDEKRRKEIPQ